MVHQNFYFLRDADGSRKVLEVLIWQSMLPACACLCLCVCPPAGLTIFPSVFEEHCATMPQQFICPPKNQKSAMLLSMSLNPSYLTGS